MQDHEAHAATESATTEVDLPRLRGVRIENERIVHAATGTIVAEVKRDAKGAYYAYRDESGRTRFTRELADIEKLGRKKMKIARKSAKRREAGMA